MSDTTYSARFQKLLSSESLLLDKILISSSSQLPATAPTTSFSLVLVILCVLSLTNIMIFLQVMFFPIKIVFLSSLIFPVSPFASPQIFKRVDNSPAKQRWRSIDPLYFNLRDSKSRRTLCRCDIYVFSRSLYSALFS